MFEKAPDSIKKAAEYWQLIEYLQKKYRKNTATYHQKAEQILSNMSPESRRRFAQYTALYMSAIEECIWLDMACKAINDYVSDDTSLYFALWVLSRGKQALLTALVDPDSLSNLRNVPYGQAEFEMFMTLGEPSGEDLIASERESLLSEITFRGGHKLGGYSSFDDAMADHEQFTPKLVKGRKKAFGKKHSNIPNMDEMQAQVDLILSQMEAPPKFPISPSPWGPEDIKKTLLPLGYTPLHNMTVTEDGFLACSYKDGNDTVLTMYQLDHSTEKEILRVTDDRDVYFICCGYDKIHLAFSYRGAGIPESSLYFYKWKSGDIREIKLPESKCQIADCSLYGDILYVSVTLDMSKILKYNITENSFALVLEQEAISAATPAATDNGIYYIRINKNLTRTLMLQRWEDIEPREIRADIQVYAAYDSVIVYVAQEPNEHVLPSFLYLYQNGEQKTLLPHADIRELSIGREMVLFTTNMMGMPNQLFVFSLENDEFYEITSENNIVGISNVDGLIEWKEYIYEKNSSNARCLVNRLIL